MILRNTGYADLAEHIKNSASRVIIYGAGMIGQIVVPYMITKYNLFRYVDCYVDKDKRKQMQKIAAGPYKYTVKAPDILQEIDDKVILLITNSNFFEVIDFLDKIPELNHTEGYIIPMMQIYEQQSAEKISVSKFREKQIIPKTIHYCWFGKKEMPGFLQKCVDSWRSVCPGYEIICWNEDNYDVSRIPYMEEAFEKKKYGFVTDVARLDILYRYGGIYIDTDVTLLRNLDGLLYQDAFTGVEKWGNINTGGCCGAVKHHLMIKKMLDYRSGFHFMREDGSLNIETNGWYETMPFLKAGMRVDNTMQRIEDVTIYPSGVFHPYDYMSCESHLEEYTYAIHHFYGGWMEKSDLENRKKTQERYGKMLERMQCGG